MMEAMEQKGPNRLNTRTIKRTMVIVSLCGQDAHLSELILITFGMISQDRSFLKFSVKAS